MQQTRKPKEWRVPFFRFRLAITFLPGLRADTNEVADVQHEQIRMAIEHGHIDVLLYKTRKRHRYVFTQAARNALDQLRFESREVFALHKNIHGWHVTRGTLGTLYHYQLTTTTRCNIHGNTSCSTSSLILFALVTLHTCFNMLPYSTPLLLLDIKRSEALSRITDTSRREMISLSCWNATNNTFAQSRSKDLKGVQSAKGVRGRAEPPKRELLSRSSRRAVATQRSEKGVTTKIRRRARVQQKCSRKRVAPIGARNWTDISSTVTPLKVEAYGQCYLVFPHTKSDPNVCKYIYSIYKKG